jgi:hypothetical protein
MGKPPSFAVMVMASSLGAIAVPQLATYTPLIDDR